MIELDWYFLAGRAIAAVVFVPLALLIQLALLAVLTRWLGIGSKGRAGLRSVFDTIEGDPRALATFLGAVVIAAGLLASALVR